MDLLTEVAALNSQVVPISPVVLNTGFTVLGVLRSSSITYIEFLQVKYLMNFGHPGTVCIVKFTVSLHMIGIPYQHLGQP